MPDVFDRKTRSTIMARIRGRRTKPELALLPFLRPLRLTYQPLGLVGSPDFADKKAKVAVFVDGCFWHGCPSCYSPPKSNRRYWREKVLRNAFRDARYTEELRLRGWTVLRFWECRVLKEAKSVADEVGRSVEEARARRRNGQ